MPSQNLENKPFHSINFGEVSIVPLASSCIFQPMKKIINRPTNTIPNKIPYKVPDPNPEITFAVVETVPSDLLTKAANASKNRKPTNSKPVFTVASRIVFIQKNLCTCRYKKFLPKEVENFMQRIIYT